MTDNDNSDDNSTDTDNVSRWGKLSLFKKKKDNTDTTTDKESDNAPPTTTDTKQQRHEEKQRHRQIKDADKEARKSWKRHKRQAKKEALLHVAGNDPSNVATWLLLIGTISTAVANGVLSSVGLFGYGTQVQQMNPILAALIPVAVEGTTLTSIAATYLLRNGKWHVRAYCWSVFGVAIAASVCGNIAHVAYTDHQKGVAIVLAAGAAVQPIFLTLSAHMLVLAMRNLEVAATLKALMVNRQENLTVAQPTSPEVSEPATVAPTVVTEPTVKRHQSWKIADTKKPSPVARQNSAERQYAQARAAEGAPVADIYQELTDKGYTGDRRNIERWTKAIRDNIQETTK